MEVVEPTTAEKAELDKQQQEKKLKRLPRARCSEVACVPLGMVKKERADAAAEEAGADNATPVVKKEKKGLFAKLTGVGSSKKRAGGEGPRVTRSKKAALEGPDGRPSIERKSLGDATNTIARGAVVEKSFFKRPKGRAPRGKTWNTEVGEWQVV